MREHGCCVTCGRTAERKEDGTFYARCSDCREKQRTTTRRPRWECPDHPGRKAVRSKFRRGELYCAVRLVNGGRCNRTSSDETHAEAEARIARDSPRWRCSQHPDAMPRPANTPGHWYCAVKVYGRNPTESQYCGVSSATETREQQSERQMAAYRDLNGGRLAWEDSGASDDTP